MSDAQHTEELEHWEQSPAVKEFRKWVDSMPQPNAETVIHVVLDPESGELLHDWGLAVGTFNDEDTRDGCCLDESVAVLFNVKFAHDGPMQGIPAQFAVEMPPSSAAALGMSLLTEVMREHPERVRGLPPLYHDLEHLADDLRAYREANGLQAPPRREWPDAADATS